MPAMPDPVFAAPVLAQPASVHPAVTTAELALRRLDPELRRFVSSYARRRPQLSMQVRAELADKLQPSLRSAVPEVFSESGPLAALDHLADLERR